MSTSAAFDQSFYLSNNTDVLIAISQGIFTSAQQHYDLFGGKELRDPNADFNAIQNDVVSLELCHPSTTGNAEPFHVDAER